jgi:hypothetical protein
MDRVVESAARIAHYPSAIVETSLPPSQLRSIHYYFRTSKIVFHVVEIRIAVRRRKELKFLFLSPQ